MLGYVGSNRLPLLLFFLCREVEWATKSRATPCAHIATNGDDEHTEYENQAKPWTDLQNGRDGVHIDSFLSAASSYLSASANAVLRNP